MTIVDFLLARTADDEAVARRASAVTAVEWVANGSVLMHIADPVIRLAEATATVEHYGMDDAWRHAERHDPARVLAECQAKRAIVAMHKPTTLEDLWGAARADIAKRLVCDYDSSPDSHLGDTAEWPCTTLRHLAAVHSDHPDYDPAWRP